MKTTSTSRRFAATLAVLTVATLYGVNAANVNAAPILAVDFQNSNNVSNPPGAVLETGFVNFDNTHSTGGGNASATYGSINVAMSGMDTLIDGLFNRGPGMVDAGSMTYADLYNDFAFKNGDAFGGGSPQSMTLTLSGAGIAANTAYDLTFYSYDDLATQGSHSVTYAAAAGTVGSAGPLAYVSGATPTSNGQYASTGTFTSNGAGVLTVSMTDAYSGATQSTGIRLNAFELSSVNVVPEPSTAVLAALGLLGLMGTRRRRRK
jgi:hypothetical protein